MEDSRVHRTRNCVCMFLIMNQNTATVPTNALDYLCVNDDAIRSFSSQWDEGFDSKCMQFAFTQIRTWFGFVCLHRLPTHVIHVCDAQ